MMRELLDKEVRLGGMLGPFKEVPFRDPCFSPLNTVPKKDSLKRRLVVDLSYPRGNSINDGIPKDTYLGIHDKMVLPSVDELVERIVTLGRNCKIFKVDLSRAYKQIMLDPLSFEKMGFSFENLFFFDCSLSMGSRSSAKCCQRVTSAVVFIFVHRNFFAINYLDDLGGCDTADRANAAFTELRTILQQFGLIEAINKVCPPSTCMLFLGIEVNMVNFTLRIPQDKLMEILEILAIWQFKSQFLQN